MGKGRKTIARHTYKPPTTRRPWKIIMPGVQCRRNSNGFMAVEVRMEADPATFTPEVVAAERAGMPGWRFRKEYLLDWTAQAGLPVFEVEWVERQRVHAREPLYRMTLAGDKLIKKDHGPLAVWIEPWEQPATLPDGIEVVASMFGIGADVGEGVRKSDSTIEVFRADDYEQAAELRSSTISQAEFGRWLAAIGRWYNDALVCVVRKMAMTVLRTLADDCGYPYIWRSKTTDTAAPKETHKLGWPFAEAHDFLFGPWIDAWQRQKITVHSLDLIEQHGQYIYDEQGRICHQPVAHLPIETRERHGDLVIAAALAWRAVRDVPMYSKVFETPVEYGSLEWRRQHYRRAQLAKPEDGVGW